VSHELIFLTPPRITTPGYMASRVASDHLCG
jgi:hypothetical protein